jgi:hypothetical protein
LNILKIFVSIKKWFENAVKNLRPNYIRYLTLDSRILLICMSSQAFEISISRVYKFTSFSINNLNSDISINSKIFAELIIQNSNFIHNIKI